MARTIYQDKYESNPTVKRMKSLRTLLSVYKKKGNAEKIAKIEAELQQLRNIREIEKLELLMKKTEEAKQKLGII